MEEPTREPLSPAGWLRGIMYLLDGVSVTAHDFADYFDGLDDRACRCAPGLGYVCGACRC